MKSKLFNLFVIIFFVFILIMVVIKKSLVYDTVSYALNIWVNSLIPTLLPFFIISDILINYNITLYIPKIIRDFCKKVFNITDNMLTIFILSMISGFPSSARNARIFYDNKKITVDEANHILMIAHFANPLFILTTVAIFFFNDKNTGNILIVSHYLSNIILALLVRKKFIHCKTTDTKNTNQVSNFGSIFILAVKKGIDTSLLVCGIVTIFLLISVIITSSFNLSVYNSMLVKGLIEITIGIESLSKLGISMTYKLVITSCFLAFGGLSIHMQVVSQIVDTDIEYKYFFIGRLWQMIISGAITYFICVLLKI